MIFFSEKYINGELNVKEVTRGYKKMALIF